MVYAMITKVVILSLMIGLVVWGLWSIRRYLGRVFLILLFLGIVFLVYKWINPSSAYQIQNQLNQQLSSSWKHFKNWIADTKWEVWDSSSREAIHSEETAPLTHEQGEFSRFAEALNSQTPNTTLSQTTDDAVTTSYEHYEIISHNGTTLILSDQNGHKEEKLIIAGEEVPAYHIDAVLGTSDHQKEAIDTQEKAHPTQLPSSPTESKPRIDDPEVYHIPSNPKPRENWSQQWYPPYWSEQQSHSSHLSSQDLQEAAEIFNL